MIVVLLDVGTLHRVGILALLVENYGHFQNIFAFSRENSFQDLEGLNHEDV